MNRPHYDLNQERTELKRERERKRERALLTRLMFPFCWRICVREVVLLLLAEPDRGEKDPAQPPALTPLLTSSDFSISAFWRERESE